MARVGLRAVTHRVLTVYKGVDGRGRVRETLGRFGVGMGNGWMGRGYCGRGNGRRHVGILRERCGVSDGLGDGQSGTG